MRYNKLDSSSIGIYTDTLQLLGWAKFQIGLWYYHPAGGSSNLFFDPETLRTIADYVEELNEKGIPQ